MSESQSLLSGTAEIKTLLDEWELAWVLGNATDFSRRDAARLALEEYVELRERELKVLADDRLRMVERMEGELASQRERIDELEDIVAAERGQASRSYTAVSKAELSRLRSTSLTPEEARVLLIYLDHKALSLPIPQRDEYVALGKSADAKLRQIAGRSTESGVPK